MIIDAFHTCDEFSKEIYKSVEGFNGDSVEIIFKSQGKWVTTQSHYEYGTVIRFCPFCGDYLED